MRTDRKAFLVLLALAYNCAIAQSARDSTLGDTVADEPAGNARVVNYVLPPPSPSASRLVRLPQIQVDDLRLEGNTVLPESEIQSMLSGYQGRPVSVEELHALRQQLSRAYFDAGYVNSGVIIPDQQVTDGTILLHAVEGTLTETNIAGNRALRTGYVERRVLDGVSQPLNIADLQQSLGLLKEDPLISSVNARLLPGDAPGDSRLELDVSELPRWQLSASADNYRPPSVAEERATLTIANRSLSGNGDVLSGRFGLTEGVEDLGLSYAIPLTRRDTRLEAYWSKTDSEIVESPFERLDIESNVESFGAVISHPFIRRPGVRLTATLGVENKRSESTLLGLPFSFSAGENDGVAEGTTAYLGAEWMRRFGSSALAIRGTLNVGLDALGSTINPDGVPDSRFTTFLGQLHYVHTLPWRNSRIVARSTFQFADSPLLAMYKLPVGGRYTVRGYRENQFVRDNGVTASLEYQVPLFVDDAGVSRANLAIAPFVDWGRSWDKEDTLLTSGTESITGAGLGLLWNPLPGLNAEIYWGYDFDDQDLPTDTLQDRGIHLQLSYLLNF